LPSDAVSQAPDLQQPSAQEVESQTQPPLEHRKPLAHSAPWPQPQLPARLQPSDRWGSQTPQAAPFTPQVAGPGVRQVVPEQQPGQVIAQPLQAPPLHVCPLGHISHAVPALPHAFGFSDSTQMSFVQQPIGHEVPSQVQVPPRQCCPGPQVDCEPQLHTPAAEQLSVSSGSQVAQATPSIPQAPTEEGLQTPLLQQPSGQLVPSQTQSPVRQCWCSPQAGSVPHRQLPSAEQVLERSRSQLTQVAPLTPHVSGLRCKQLPSWQQPDGQELESHTQRPSTQRAPPWQAEDCPQLHPPSAPQPSAPMPQARQTPPPCPQSLAVVAWTQVLPVQQPSGQELGVHTHEPFTHASPKASQPELHGAGVPRV
jgi:hypothetical protein